LLRGVFAGQTVSEVFFRNRQIPNFLGDNNMFNRKPLAVAVTAALGVSSFGVLGSAAYAQDNVGVSDDGSIEEIVTTGSRIKRSTNTESQEIITFTIEDMEMSGDISISDALRTSTMNSLGSFRESSGSSAQSNATFDLRGVGASRTLILVNGRRVVGSPSLGGGGTVNLNMLPFSAVDRVEVIADGASAIYGSDAVAGVVNVILKKNYDGMKVSARYGDRYEDDGVEQSFSFLTGASSERGSVTFGLEWDTRDAIFDADRDYTKASYSDLNGDGEIEGYAETVGVSVYGYTLINPTYDSTLPFDPNNQATWQVSPGANCQDGVNGYAGVMNADSAFGATDIGYYCGYAFALVSANRASMERINTWVSSEYELTDSITLHADAILAQNESFGRYAPPAAPGPTIPGDPRNDVGATFGYFRWTDIGTRDNIVNDTLTDINVGAEGELTDSISWDINYTYSNYVSSSVGQYYLNYGGLAYNIYYGISDFDTFVSNIKHTTLNDDRQKLEKVTGGMQFDMFEMSGGTVTAYVGAEYYTVDYAALVDAQSEAGLVGGSAGNSAIGARDVTAIFAEAIFPVTDWMEIDAAVRYDDYSDFGDAVSPRLGITARVPGIEGLTLKTSYGEGFRAPDLSDMYGATSFSAEFARDYWGCQVSGTDPCPRIQFSTYIGSNPNLDAEKSETFSFGVDYEFLDAWRVSVSYFDLTLSDSINYTSAQDQLDVDFQTMGNNPNVVRGVLGVESIAAGFQNGTTDQNRQVLDYAVSANYDTRWGNFMGSVNASQYLNYDAELSYGTGDLYDAVGTLGFPEWRTNVMLRWELGDVFTSMNYDFIGENQSQISGVKWESWDVINLALGYSFGDKGTVTLGANNLLNDDPILNATTGDPVDEYQYDQTGRVVYVRYAIEF
jgi:iron complex outermembrane receptor protein